jgi:hypothetical protein
LKIWVFRVNFQGFRCLETINFIDVYGELARIHVADEVIMPDGKMDIARIRPLARLGYYDYTSVTDVFEVCIPGASGAAAAGLEGKASEYE